MFPNSSLHEACLVDETKHQKHIAGEVISTTRKYSHASIQLECLVKDLVDLVDFFMTKYLHF